MRKNKKKGNVINLSSLTRIYCFIWERILFSVHSVILYQPFLSSFPYMLISSFSTLLVHMEFAISDLCFIYQRLAFSVNGMKVLISFCFPHKCFGMVWKRKVFPTYSQGELRII